MMLRLCSLLTVAVLLNTTTGRSLAAVLPDIYWNSTNPQFGSIDGEYVVEARIRDSAHIICPFYDAATTNDAEAEQSLIYRVTKFGYDNCVIGGAEASAVLVGGCRQPFNRSVISIVFRAYSPLSNPEYRPGYTYYFISTSTGRADGVENTVGGLCATQSRRLRLDVLTSSTAKTTSSPRFVSVGGSRRSGATSRPPPRRFFSLSSRYDGRFPLRNELKKTAAYMTHGGDKSIRFDYFASDEARQMDEGVTATTARREQRDRLKMAALFPFLRTTDETVRRNAHLPIKFKIGYEDEALVQQSIGSSSLRSMSTVRLTACSVAGVLLLRLRHF